MAKLVLAHKLTLRDPTAFEEGGEEAEVASALLREPGAGMEQALPAGSSWEKRP
jgi:hypothetical protein